MPSSSGKGKQPQGGGFIAPDPSQFLNSAGAGGTQSLSGSSSANLNTKVWVPSTPGSNIGLHQETIQDYVNSLSPGDLMEWEPLLTATGYATTLDANSLRNDLAQVLYDSAQSPATQGGAAQPNAADYLQALYTAQQNAAPTGYARAYKGGSVSVPVTSQQTVLATADQIAQQLLGRHARPDEIAAITSILNQQEYAKGSADVATQEAQQAAMVEAYQGGQNATSAGAAASNNGGGLDQFMAAIRQHESGGNYSAQNGDSGARGAYQIMPSNWSSWAQAAGLAADAPWTQQNQDTVAAHQMQQLYNDLGNWQAVAVAWYAGESAAKKWLQNPNDPEFTAKQGGGKYPSINDYVQQVAGQLPADGSGVSLPQIQPLAPGQLAAPPQTVGTTQSVRRGNETYSILPPTANVYQAPQSPSDAAASYYMTNKPEEYQAHNLMNVFSVIHGMLGGAATNKGGPLQQGLSMP